MEQETVYNLEFDFLYLDVVNFKQKQASIIRGCISGGRLNDYMKFESYGYISFDEHDHKHQFPKIQTSDKFNRLKCNCLVYDLSYNSSNNGKYDKCFVYATYGKSDSYYGYMFYNTKTKKSQNKCLLEGASDTLCIKLIQSFNTMLSSHIYSFYSNKYDAVKGRNGKTLADCPGVKEYNDMYDEYCERQKIPFKWS